MFSYIIGKAYILSFATKPLVAYEANEYLSKVDCLPLSLPPAYLATTFTGICYKVLSQ